MNTINQTLKENVRLVYQAINDLQYVPQNIDMEELEQIGKIALWKAIESYDEDSGIALSTHCYRTINGDIIDFLRKSQAKKRQEVIITKPYEENFDNGLISSLLVEEIRKYLSEQEFTIFCEKVVAGLTLDQLEEKYGMTKMQIRYVVTKAKKKLKLNVKWEASYL